MLRQQEEGMSRGQAEAGGEPSDDRVGAERAGPSGARPLLIVNADDFGSSRSVNAAVIEAHRRGVLSSASLMVTGEAAEEAVELARCHPELAVGLHLVLIQGRAASSPDRLPRLVRSDGTLPDDPVSTGLRLAFSPQLRHEVTVEIEAQLERFAATGLALSHVDGHLNFHMHPVAFSLLAPRAAARGASGVRLPRDDLRLALRHGSDRLAQRLVWAAAFGLLSAWARRRLPPGLRAADRVYGLFQTGRVTAPYLLDLIARLESGSAELYLHPATQASGEALGPNAGDLRALLDPAVTDALRSSRVRLGSYAALAAA